MEIVAHTSGRLLSSTRGRVRLGCKYARCIEQDSVVARGTVSDLSTFLVVARNKNFAKGAVKLGLYSSVLSHTIRNNLGVWLLTRTIPSVSLTETGERLLQTIRLPVGRSASFIRQPTAGVPPGSSRFRRHRGGRLAVAGTRGDARNPAS
ncbi:MAG: LysR family transcriptional regulator [Shinella sp.]